MRQPKHLPRESWNSPIKDYDQLTQESCKFMFGQAKEYFEETVRESEELTQRGTRILFLLLPSVAAVVAFCFSNQEKLRPITGVNWVFFGVAVGSLSVCIYSLFVLIRPKSVHYRGSQPEKMMRLEIFALGQAEQIEKALYISEIERCQIKIEQMEIRNVKRIRVYRTVVYSFNLMIAGGIMLLVRSI